MATMEQHREYPMDKRAKHPTRWSFVHSNVVPSNVTVTQIRSVRTFGNVPAGWQQIQGSVLRPATNPAAWYVAKDRSKPSVSSF